MRQGNVARHNRIAVALLLAAFIALLAVLSLRLYSFDSGVYTKRCPNTFVGDEKYNAALEELRGIMEEYREDGIELKLNESVTERVNSKGERTSLVVFTLNDRFKKTGWDFLGAGIAPSWVLTAMLTCAALGAACAAAGTLGHAYAAEKALGERERRLRSAACWLLLIALLLVPVFAMTSTYTLSRRVALLTAGVETEGRELLFSRLDAFLFGGNAGENIDFALKNTVFESTGALWTAVPCLFAMLLSAVQLRFGAVKHTLLRGLLYAFVIAMCLFILYPYYVMLVTAFRSNAESTDMHFRYVMPTVWRLQNMKDIISRGVPRYLSNSLLIAGGATLIALLCGVPAAYAMSRRKFKGKKAFLGFVIMSQMFSPVVLLVGIAQLMSALNLNDSILGLMLINAAFNQAFAIWLLRGTFVSISPEMEQAARIDGCTSLGSLWHVLLPMAAPGIVTTLIFVFINAWNEYTISTVLISTASNRPITVGITQFSSFNMIEWQYLFAASLLATVPVVILFMCIEKHLTSGLTSGGVKV